MRPIRLEFAAFGSYPGREVVDFDALGRRGLFVVTGPTGTGKSTVFDAMVYALFGAMPGARQGITDLRSHFAAPGVETSVTLEFEVDGSRYVVSRAPRQERLKQRGSGVTEAPAKASLVRVVGTATEPLASQAKAVTQRCEALVGLDATRFQRVVLLPQGTFTEFLIATDDDRETLLRQLFGGQLYEDAVVWLRNRMNALAAAVGDVDTQLQHLRANAVDSLVTARGEWWPVGATGLPNAGDDRSDGAAPAVAAAFDVDATALVDVADARLRDLATELEPSRAAALASITGLSTRAGAAAAHAAEARAAAGRFDDAVALRSALTDLDGTRAQVEAAAARAARSASARPVVESEAARVAAVAAHAAAESQVGASAARIEDGFVALGAAVPEATPAAVAAALEQVAHRLSADEALLGAVESATTAAATASAAHAAAVEAREAAGRDHDAALAEVDRLGSEVAAGRAGAADVEVLTPQVATVAALVSRRADLDRLESSLPGLDAEAARLDAEYLAVMARFVATQAPRLAEQLVDGQPCAVCGSTDHPAPARPAEGEVVDHDTVDRARQRLAQAQTATAEHRAAAAAVRVGLGDDASTPLDELTARHAALVERLAGATAAAAALGATETALADAADAAARCAAAVVAADGEVIRAAAEVERTAAGLAGAQDAAAHLDATGLAHRRRTIATLDGAATELAGCLTASVRTAEAVRTTTEGVAAALAASGLPSVGAAASEVIDPVDEARGHEALAAHAAATNDARSKLAVLEQQGIPTDRPDVDGLEAAARALSAEVTAVTARVTTASNALDAALSALDELGTIAAGSAAMRLEYDDARTVYRTCAGEAGMRVRLERWVLAGELDRVTDAANVHLATMTGHRYRLVRDRTSKGGLTLEVFDAHTGRTRSTSSLSGGEQFQASLSLALGLADVVSHGGTASGRQFDALFVDEGFGSLDPDALDDAIRALSMLQAAGRMVGAITHVEAMKQQLHVGIEVRRLGDGRGSTLLVNP